MSIQKTISRKPSRQLPPGYRYEYSNRSGRWEIYNPENVMLYQPFQSQAEFHGAGEFEVLYGGSTGPGKSRALGEEAMEVGQEAPGARIVVARLHKVDLMSTTYQVFMDEVFSQLSPNERKMFKSVDEDGVQVVKFPLTGFGRRQSVIRFMGLKSASGRHEVSKIKSQSISVLLGDEVSEWPETLYTMWFTQLRHEVPGLRCCQAKMATNPDPGTWPHYRFVFNRDTGKPWTKEELTSLTPPRRFIPALSRDNPFLPSDYQDRFLGLSEVFRRRYQDGDWSYFTGAAIQNFDANRCVIPYKSMDLTTWKSYIYVDHGQANPCSIHRYNVNNEGSIIVDWEYYQPGQVREHARAIVKCAKITPNLEGIYIDQSAFQNRSEKYGLQWSVGDEYNERLASEGLMILPSPSSQARDLVKVARMERAFAYDEHRLNPFTRQPGWQEQTIMNNCKKAIWEIPNIRWKEPSFEGMNSPEQLIDRDNHFFDEDSYMLLDNDQARETTDEEERKKYLTKLNMGGNRFFRDEDIESGITYI